MTDSFAPIARVPTSVGPVEIVLTVTPGTPNEYAGRYNFDVLDADGKRIETRNGNLPPHLTAAQINAIKSFMDAMLTKAQGAIV